MPSMQTVVPFEKNIWKTFPWTITVLSYKAIRTKSQSQRKIGMRGYNGTKARKQFAFSIAWDLRTKKRRYFWAIPLCVLPGGVIKYDLRASAGGHAVLIWYLGRGANINVALPRAKPPPPPSRECFYMQPPPTHRAHVMPRHPIKLMSHAGFMGAVGPGKQVPP